MATVFAGLALAGLAVADGGAAPVSLTWDAPPACSDAKTIEAEVQRLLGVSTVSPEKHVVARAKVVSAGRGALRVQLTTDRGAAHGVRTVDAASCRAAAESTALILALTIDPAQVAARGVASGAGAIAAPVPAPVGAPPVERAGPAGAPRSGDAAPGAPPPAASGPPSPSPGGPAAPPSGSVAPPSGASGVTASVAPPSGPGSGAPPLGDAGGANGEPPAPGEPGAAPPASDAAQRGPAAARRSPAPEPPRAGPPPTSIAIAAFGMVDQGSMPSAALGIGGAIAWMSGRARVEAGAASLPASTASVTADGSRGGHFQLAMAQLRVCYDILPAGLFSLSPCAAGEVGSMAATGFGVQAPSSGTALFVAAGPGILGAIRLGDAFALRVTADLGLVFTRAQFVLDQVGAVHQPSVFAGSAALGGEIRF